jgi:AcrR family transcriptional regulator
MVRAAALLFQERGYAATSFQDVIARSGAPRGSIYHHFPGGKQELAIEALRWYSDRTSALMRQKTEESTAIEAVAGFFAISREALRKSDFRAGCPVAGVALDLADNDEELQAAVAQAFEEWRRVLAAAFERDGATPAKARRLAAFVYASLEGALMLARAQRDLRPMDDVITELLDHLERASGSK